MNLTSKTKIILTAALLVLIAIFIYFIYSISKITLNLEMKKNENALNDASFFKVKRAIDGDTIELEDGSKVRYIGINAPETVDPESPVQCFGKEASLENKELVEGKNVRLEKDLSDTDKYGRLLRYVYLEDGTFVNLVLVQDGFAFSSAFPPDNKYQINFDNAQKKAKDNGAGLWSANACSGELKSL